ncbi:MAG TPA: STAS domain-containing protein [Planctomycetaceae bacterium]|jgi:anti-anti-sigma factor|nr:STAS domain-containing protein [Planctomycetaceae bacterium]
MFSVVLHGTVHVLSGKESITEPNLPELNRYLDDCLRSSSARVVLNLSEIPLFDSLGLEWLLTSAERCAERGGQLQIAAANPLCRDILGATGVAERFEHFDDVRTAVRSFTR